MNTKIVLAVVIAWLVGGFMGVLTPSLASKINFASTESQFQMKYPEGRFTQCDNLVYSQQTICLDSSISDVAVMRKSVAVCDDIKTDNIKQDCQARVTFVTQVTGDPAKFCQNFANNDMCQDLARVLLTSNTRNLNDCNDIHMDSLKTACKQLVPGATLAGPASPSPAAASQVQFGLNCDPKAPNCVKDTATFNAAVLNNKVADCKNLGNAATAQACEYEVDLYQVSLHNDLKLCGSIPADACQYGLILAQAVDKHDVSICQQLSAKDAAAACVDAVGKTKEKRFDYLKTQ